MSKAVSRAITTGGLIMVLLLTAPLSMADEWPLASGDYWTMIGVDVKDGDDFKYAEWLATEWRENTDFWKSKGWMKDAFVLYNTNARQGEPDLYLVTIRESLPSGPAGEARGQEFREWKKRTIEKLVDESGDRAAYREITGSMLLQHRPFRD